MTDHAEEVDTLLNHAWNLPHGDTQVKLCEQAVQIADRHQDLDLAFGTRQALLRAATFSGRPDLALISFSWCLAQHDRDPERHRFNNLLWQFKWIGDEVGHFPQITRRQLEDLASDMERRYRAAGASQRSVHKIRAVLAEDLGDLDELPGRLTTWLSTGRSNDSYSDCRACDLHIQGFLLTRSGQVERALSVVEPVLQRRATCAEVPAMTYAWVLLPLVQSGSGQRAAEYHHRGMAAVGRNQDFAGALGQHLTYLALTDQLETGADLVTQYPAWLMTRDPKCRLDLMAGARRVVRKLVASGRGDMPAGAPSLGGEAGGAVWTMRRLADWLDDQIGRLASDFDASNGNRACSALIAEHDLLAGTQA